MRVTEGERREAGGGTGVELPRLPPTAYRLPAPEVSP
jgi:hypothetical protein